LPTFYGDFCNICAARKNVLWWDLRDIQKAENLLLTKIGGDFTLKIPTHDTLRNKNKYTINDPEGCFLKLMKYFLLKKLYKNK